MRIELNVLPFVVATVCILDGVHSFVTTPKNILTTLGSSSARLQQSLHAYGKTFWKENEGEYEVKFFDDFDGDAIDTSVWSHFIGPGPAGNELQVYTDSDKNSFVKDSVLYVRAIEEPINYNGWWTNWTSARLETKQKFNFTYGRMSTRIRCKAVPGPFSAVWALSEKYGDDSVGWPLCGEIDFFEMQTLWEYTPSTLHFKEHNGGSSMSWINYETFDTVHEWHEYGVEWEDNYIAFYHDGKRIGEYPQPSPDGPGSITDANWPYNWQNKFYFIINNAMNPSWGSKSDPNFTMHDLEVDWIKLEQKKK